MAILAMLEHGRDARGTPPACLLTFPSQSMYTSPVVCAGIAMPFCHPFTEFPALTETIRHHQNSSDENRCRFRVSGSTSGGVDSKVYRAPRTPRAAVERTRRPKTSCAQSHDMYENEGTYAENVRFSEKAISLITSLLAARLEIGQGELKVKAKATMLQKTKEAESCDLIKATMLMKTKHL
jgi:hypothetical protein